MEFKLKNFGKIAEADIKLDGITVICGDNDTGKSTVGKALFAFFNSLVNYKQKIADNRYEELCDYLENVSGNNFFYFENEITSDIRTFINKKRENINQSEVTNFFNSILDIKLSKSESEHIMDILNTSDEDIINEYIFRFFDVLMNGQVKNILNIKSDSYIKSEFKHGDFVNSVKFLKNKSRYSQDVPIVHRAYYINSPFVLDWLNNPNRRSVLWAMNPMDKSTVSAIIQAQAAINADPMTNVIDSVINRAELKIVEDVLKKAYHGTTKIINGKYFYTDENGKDFDFRNISAGLKSFALIERMLETGVLKKKDVLILDEPEIHLHSEWQIIYAELIVILQKHFDLTILIVTHSFQFLESLNFFMKKYEIFDKVNYYIPERTDKGVVMKSYDNNSGELKKNLSKGTFKIADLEYEFDMEQEDEEY